MAQSPPPLLSGPSTKFSPARRDIYDVLVRSPGHYWTVADLAAALITTSPGMMELVRSTLNVLTSRQLMRCSPRGRRLTFVLTAAGATQLRRLLAVWPAGEASSRRTGG
jgi:hypothetical protein